MSFSLESKTVHYGIYVAVNDRVSSEEGDAEKMISDGQAKSREIRRVTFREVVGNKDPYGRSEGDHSIARVALPFPASVVPGTVVGMCFSTGAPRDEEELHRYNSMHKCWLTSCDRKNRRIVFSCGGVPSTIDNASASMCGALDDHSDFFLLLRIIATRDVLAAADIRF